MHGQSKCSHLDIYRNSLILLRLLNAPTPIRYTQGVPTSRWGEAIALFLAERGWTQKQLSEAAHVRPNTLTNLIKHGRDSDTATLQRIAKALSVDLSELFLTREQIETLRAYKENRVDRLKQAVLKEVSEIVTKQVRKELERAETAKPSAGRKRPGSSRQKH